MGDRSLDVVPDRASLERLLREFRELPPKVQTRVRRELRGVGDEVIAGQRKILSGPLPQGVVVTGKRLGVVESGSRARFKILNVYSDSVVSRPGRGAGLREGIKDGLRTRVITGQTRQGIEIRTTGPKLGDGKQYNGAKFWNKKRFRHPVFGRDNEWVDQAGQQYWREPAVQGHDDMAIRAVNILNDAIEGK